MTESTSIPGHGQEPPTPSEFRDSEELRCPLCRLHEDGTGAWAHDPVAAELMRYARDKYAALAVKHRLDPWEAASAAFRAMINPATRDARDPWAVITHAVRIACSVEERSQGLLCTPHKARRSRFAEFHDPERFSDRDLPITDYHPAFAILESRFDDIEATGPEPASTSVQQAIDAAITLLTLLGWPSETSQNVVEHVCDALTKAGTRQAAYQALRSDRQTPVLMDLPRPAWSALLRALLGSPEPAHVAMPLGRGVLLRLLIGETLPVLLDDDDLVSMLALTGSGVGR